VVIERLVEIDLVAGLRRVLAPASATFAVA
jgi:hypothetical protein